MADLFPKFIIEDGKLIISKVTFHSQLVTNKDKVQGGGWFKFESGLNMFVFYGESQDYGKATIDDIRSCLENGRVYSNKLCIRQLKGYLFGYDTGSEVIIIKQ